jgi:hypothetical protein
LCTVAADAFVSAASTKKPSRLMCLWNRRTDAALGVPPSLPDEPLLLVEPPLLPPLDEPLPPLVPPLVEPPDVLPLPLPLLPPLLLPLPLPLAVASDAPASVVAPESLLHAVAAPSARGKHATAS